jgi:CRP/FNR family transcriptional regulator
MLAPVRQVLKDAALFAALNESELNSLAARCGLRSYAAGEILFGEGQPCAGLHIVTSGRIRIFKTSPAGREQVLAIEGPGASVAELPVFDGDPYPASAAAVESSNTLFISRDDLRALCLEHPQIALKMLQVAGARLRRLVGIIEELSFTTVRGRLISWLLRQAGPEECAARRPVTFALNASHQEIAAQIGTVRELVSRNMARLQAQGLIESRGREVTIPDPEALEADLTSGL